MATIFRSASIWLKIAMAAMGLGLILFVIGFATDSWMVSPRKNVDIRNGLWKGTDCYRRRSCFTYELSVTNDYHRAIQAMECLGLIGFVIATIILLLYMILDSCRRRDFLQGTTALTFAGLACACIGFAIYGSSSNNDNIYGRGYEVGWSMGVACTGAAFYGLAGIMLIIQLIR